MVQQAKLMTSQNTPQHCTVMHACSHVLNEVSYGCSQSTDDLHDCVVASTVELILQSLTIRVIQDHLYTYMHAHSVYIYIPYWRVIKRISHISAYSFL